MKVIKIKGCIKCPYFNTEMNDETHKLYVWCSEKNKDYETIIGETNIDCLKYETDKEIDEVVNNLRFSIPKWCPLEDYKK